VRESAALAALLYVLAYLLVHAWGRRSPAQITAICPLRSASLPEEIQERLGPPAKVPDGERFARAEFTIGYLTDAPGIAVALLTDEASLDEALGPYMRQPIFIPDRAQCLRYLSDWKWGAGLLFGLALEVLHRRRPQSLLVDFRPPPNDVARARRISTVEPDLDLGMYAYELIRRLGRYSRYRDATFRLVFCDAEAAWVFAGRASSLGHDRRRRTVAA